MLYANDNPMYGDCKRNGLRRRCWKSVTPWSSGLWPARAESIPPGEADLRPSTYFCPAAASIPRTAAKRTCWGWSSALSAL